MLRSTCIGWPAGVWRGSVVVNKALRVGQGVGKTRSGAELSYGTSRIVRDIDNGAALDIALSWVSGEAKIERVALAGTEMDTRWGFRTHPVCSVSELSWKTSSIGSGPANPVVWSVWCGGNSVGSYFLQGVSSCSSCSRSWG